MVAFDLRQSVLFCLFLVLWVGLFHQVWPVLIVWPGSALRTESNGSWRKVVWIVMGRPSTIWLK